MIELEVSESSFTVFIRLRLNENKIFKFFQEILEAGRSGIFNYHYESDSIREFWLVLCLL